MIGLITDYDAIKYTVIRMDKKDSLFEVTMLDMGDDRVPLIKAEVSVYNGISKSIKYRRVFTSKLLSHGPDVRITQEARVRLEEIAVEMVGTYYSESEDRYV